MNFKKIIGILLIIACLATITGFVLNNHIFWFITDIYNILICGITGLLLILKK